MQIFPQKHKTKILFALGAAIIIIFATVIIYPGMTESIKQVIKRTSTVTATMRPSVTHTRQPTITATFAAPTIPAPITPDADPDNIAAYPSAPLCEEHTNNEFHTLWNSQLGCHYDHEHGSNPFTPEIAATFPAFDLYALLGNVEVGHSNPSSPAENTAKHGGFKWQVDVAAPRGCATGFEDGTIAVKSYAIQFHAFGRQDIEHEARNHSSVALLAFCKSDNPNDVGYMYVVQLQEYGQRVMPYQGYVMPYPDNFQPEYISPRGPYFTTECFGDGFSYVDMTGVTRLVSCRPTHDDRNNNLTVWSSKPTQSSGSRERPATSSLFRLLFRGLDNYQRVDVRDLVHPFTWMFVCGGEVFNPDGCRFNNSSATIHEVVGDIPAAWDGASFDTDPRVGRVSFTGFVDRFGTLLTALECQVAGGNCHPIVLVSAFVGKYSSELSAEKVSNPTPENTRERDYYFCNGVLCSETSPGAVPSGWILENN